MPKNLPIEVTKIEDFIMEDDKFNNIDSWVNHVVEDLQNLAYRKSNGTLVTDRANATNLKLADDRYDGLLEDLKYRFEKKGETSRLIEIERRLVGKYKISMVDKETKIKRKAVLDEFIQYFNTTPITNQNDPQKIKEESISEEIELTLDEVIRRGLLIASIQSNKKIGVGGVIATLINYPVKDIERGDVARKIQQEKMIPEFESFMENKSIEDLKMVLKNEFPNFKFSKPTKEKEQIYEIEYFFPIGDFYPKIVYYENKTLDREGEVSLKALIKKFNVKSDESLMDIYNWMIAHQPDGPEYPQSTGGSYVMVLTNRPSTSLRPTTGMPWYNGGSCASWQGGAGPRNPMGRNGYTSSWTGWTDMKYMNMMALIFANNDSGESDLEEINSDWPIVYDDTCKGRIILRWGYVSDDDKFKTAEEKYDNTARIGFSVEPYYGVESNKKNQYRKILTTGVSMILNESALGEKYWQMLHAPHRHWGATDRTESAIGGGGVSGYGKQIRTKRQGTINGSYYVDESIDVLDEQKNIAMSNTLTIGDAMGLSKRRIPAEVRVLLAQNPRIWLYPTAINELFGLKDLTTNLILLNSLSCTSQQLLEFFNHLDFYEKDDQFSLIKAILKNQAFDEIIENRLINYIKNNPSPFEELFNRNKIYTTLSIEDRITYSLFLLLDAPDTVYSLYYIPFSQNTVSKMIDILTNRRSVTGTYGLIHSLLFAKNTNTTTYIKLLDILKRSLKYKKNKYVRDASDSLNLVLSSYIINYNLLDNNTVRDYYLQIIKTICTKEAIEAKPNLIESFIIGERDSMHHFLDRQGGIEGIGSLPFVYDYYLECLNKRNDYHDADVIRAFNKESAFPEPSALGMFLLLNSKPRTIENYNSIEKIGAMLGTSDITNFSELSDMTLYSLLSCMLDFDNPNLVGEKIISNPALRIELFKALENKSFYDRNFTELIRQNIVAFVDVKNFTFYKDEIESYILNTIMENKYYSFTKFKNQITVSRLASCLIDPIQIDELFFATLKRCFGAFHNRDSFIVRNPLPVEQYMGAIDDGDIESILELEEVINNIKESEEWKMIQFSLFGSLILGFCKNPRLSQDIQNFIIFDLLEIAKEYEFEDAYRKLEMPSIYLEIASNPNISLSCIKYLLDMKVPELQSIKNRLAQNPNIPMDYLISNKISTKNTLFDLFPYEVLMNTQIDQNDFYKLYNYILTILNTNISPKTFNMNQFVNEKLNPYLSFEKGLELRKSMEQLLYSNNKDVYYWRGGFNLAKKFNKIDDINYWLMGGGEGGIADNPIIPSKEYQQFSILKWDSDKSKNILINIENHKLINERLVYVEGTKTYFDEHNHLQTIPIGENLEINRLFGFIPEDARTPPGKILYCNTCLERTTEKGKPVKYRFNTMEDALKHKENKHPDEEDFIAESDKIRKWTHECVFVIIDNQPPPKELRIPDWRYTLTTEAYKNLINTIGVRVGSIAMFDRLYDTLPLSCNLGNQKTEYQIKDMIMNINTNQAWSVDFIDENLDLLCNAMEGESGNMDMWSNFVFTSDFIEHAIGLFNDNPENYSDLMIYILGCIDLDIIDSADLEDLSFKIADIDTLIMVNRFLSEVKF
jgi:hypothetical protein